MSGAGTIPAVARARLRRRKLARCGHSNSCSKSMNNVELVLAHTHLSGDQFIKAVEEASMSEHIDEAEKKYCRDADRGDPVAQFKLGHAYYLEARFGTEASGDYSQATPLIQKAAGQGYETAMLFLSIMYQSGEGVSVDFDKSKSLFLSVAEQGDPLAQYGYAMMCWNSDFGRREPDEAEAWWLKAAEQGLTEAHRTLGDFYGGFEGRKTLRDPVQSYMWYTLAALRHSPGNMPAASRTARDRLAEQMLQEQITEAERRVQAWLEKHTDVMGGDLVNNWSKRIADPLKPLTATEFAEQEKEIDALIEEHMKETQDILDKDK